MSERQHTETATSAAPSTPPTLDPIGLPLTGSRLIEASAGTGKTFTIALLYVRLVLGPRGSNEEHADAANFPRALTPPEILVVTFTNAATQELRDRIRARLVEASDAFLQASDGEEGADGDPPGGDPPGGDPLLALRDSYPVETWPACARRLQLAAEWMDEAAVSTIHAWCYRMLREHAFDSGSLFSLNLETDQSELELEVARDYWRSFYYALPQEDLATVTPHWKSPEELNAAVARLREHAAALAPAAPPAESLARVREDKARALAALKAPWKAAVSVASSGDIKSAGGEKSSAWVDSLEEAIEEAAARKAFDARKLNTKNRAAWLQALRDWVADPEQVSPALSEAAWKRLSPEGFAEIWKDGPVLDHPALEALAALPDRLDALPEAYPALIRHAVHWMAERREQAQARRAEMGPNDLLTHLDRALSGGAGKTLATRIRQQFPVALVDEFQDTDPIQYRLFSMVYRLGETPDAHEGDGDALQEATGVASGVQHAAASGVQHEQASAVLLIGDPKQAIYAFRGADIHTYLKARRDTAGRHVTLGTNFRSSAAMVAAVNRCFAHAEADPRGAGAFLFKAPDGDNPVPFTAVAAKGRKDALTRDGTALPALTLWHLEADEPLAKTPYLRAMAERCASRMATLLIESGEGRIGFSSEASAERAATFTPLAPSDLAVLVNNGGEARAIRTALAARGIRSVYLSDKDGVFETAAAAELETWLRAAAAPDDGRALRAALATPSLGLSLAELDALTGSRAEDELAWEARVLQFRDYHRLWQRQGVLPMLRRLLTDFGVPTRLLAAEGGLAGERTLTDFLHLGELLQQASQELDGEHALVRHLAEARANPLGQDDTHRLRLESDADLVQVITIHKSKGLEYPLVFLPFIASVRETKATDSPLRYHDDEGALRIALTADEAVLARADRERLGEDLRKLYVALTRARHATWLGLAPLKGLEKSAIGQLLNAGEPIAPEALRGELERLKGDCNAIAVQAAPEVEMRLVAQQEARHLGPAREPLRRAKEHWWIASYSALTLGSTPEGATPEGAVPEVAASAEAPDQADDLSPAGTPDAPAITAASAEAASSAEPTTALEATAREMRDEPEDARTGTAISAPEAALHRFPRGPGPGTFLHGLLEWAGHQGFGRVQENPDALRDTLQRRTQLRGWGDWAPALGAWLETLLSRELPLPAMPDPSEPHPAEPHPAEPLPAEPLPAEPHPSRDVPSIMRLDALASYQVELEFWFAVHKVDTRQLDALVSAYTLPGRPRPALDADTLNGMLKGFIDLVAECDGRYYVFDWKSNHLGLDDDAYTPDAMAQAVLAKRYDVQYALYLLALHRLLESRLPDYDIDRHLGGALYVFLRGIQAPACGVHGERPPRALIEGLDALFRQDAHTDRAATAGAPA